MLFFAEVIDKIGTGFEPGCCAILLVPCVLALTKWTSWIPILISIVMIAIGTGLIVSDVRTVIGQAILSEIGWSYYVRWFLAWNLPWLAAMVFTVPLNRWWTKRARLANGLCEKCGYDRTGLPADRACPECGAAVSSR